MTKVYILQLTCIIRKEPVQIHVFCALKFRGKENRVKNIIYFYLLAYIAAVNREGYGRRAQKEGDCPPSFCTLLLTYLSLCMPIMLHLYSLH